MKQVLEDLERYASEMVETLRKRSTPQLEINRFMEHVECVREKLVQMTREGIKGIKTDRVETLKRVQNLWNVVRFRGALKQSSGVGVTNEKSDGSDIFGTLGAPVEAAEQEIRLWEKVSFTFGEPDEERHLIATLPTTRREIVDEFQGCNKQVLFAVTGILLPDLVNEQFLLLLIELQAMNSPIDFVDMDPAESQQTDLFLKEHEGKSLLPVLVQRIRTEMQVEVEHDPLYAEALHALVLQAASHGLIDGENGRIHGLVIGAPGCGKGVLGQAVEAIQPICTRVETQAVTEDGLYGNTGSANGTRVTRVGLIPQAHQGAVIIEDFFSANSLKNRRLCNILTYTMERGRCEAANASRMSYPAEVSFWVDSNRLTDVDVRRRAKTVGGVRAITVDTGLPVNTLTRFNYIVEFPRDPNRQVALAMKLAGKPVTTTSIRKQRCAGVRLALAVLRTRIPSVSINAETAAYLQGRFAQAVNVPQALLREHPNYVDFLTRGVKSFRKFITAHARLCQRTEANPEDVDATFPFVMRTFETVLSWIGSDLNSESTQHARKAARQTLISVRFAGRRVSLDELARHLPNVSAKTIRRDLSDIAGEPSGNMWSVPAEPARPLHETQPGPSTESQNVLPSVGEEERRTA